MDEKKSFKEFLCTNSGFAVMVIVAYVLDLALMALIGAYAPTDAETSTFWMIFSLIIFVMWTVFGWKSLSVIQPRIFLIMPIAGWIAYFLIKGILSVIVGVFVTPYQVAKMIRNQLQKSL